MECKWMNEQLKGRKKVYNGWVSYLRESQQPCFAISESWAPFGEEDTGRFSILGRQLTAKPEAERKD